MAAAAGATDWPTINAAAREQAKTPIRAGEPGIRPFWNAYSKAFIHPPAFDFKEIPGAGEYRFTIEGNQEQSNADESARSENSPHLTHSWLAPHPWLPLDAAAWDSLAPGYYTLRVEALGADGAPLAAPASERRFYRAAVFHGPYPAAPLDYRKAAGKVYAAVFNMPQVQGWRTSDDPPQGYDLYCYPAKILSSMIRALCRHAAAEPKDAPDALAIARKMADWLIAHSQPPDAPLAHFPPTYWGDRRDVAVKYAGQNMLLYPAHAALAYFDLAEATGNVKYRDAALAIARTYVKLQGADGTWPLKVLEKDGSPVRANRLLPGRYLLGAFDRGGADFAAARDRAFAFIEREPLADWNWDGQFEDMDPMPPYQNLQKGVAVDTALRLFKMGRNAEALEIVDWCEDQFTVWSDPIHHMDWQHWKTPTALEQYDYYTPIDASMGDMIGAFAAAYRATGDVLYLEKSRALADNITRNQRADGTIPTYFDSRNGSDWVNCMVYVADRLEYLSDSEP
jgi:maltose/maltodextrin transport system substrate-binding protein